MPSTLAIIGTAGRGDDKVRLTHHHYDRMFNAVTKIMVHTGIDPQQIKVTSGGAAWADHLVVTLGLLGGCSPDNITLYLPADIGEQAGYFGKDERSEKTANTCNYYHRLFRQTTGIDGIQEILRLRDMGATLDPGNGNFHARNAMVAKAVTPDGLLLAFTFGADSDIAQPVWTARPFSADTKADQAGLKDGGTAHTFGLAKCSKWHIRLGNIDPLVTT